MQDQLPPNGIYFFFERGEVIQLDGTTHERVTQIGTHIKPGRLSKRIQQHFGNKNSLGGSKNASVLRRHLGGAMLRRNDPTDSRIEGWITHGGPIYREIEEQVSQVLRDDFSFVCIAVDEYDDRKFLVRGLIALLAQLPIGAPSDSWLGHFAAAEEIRQTGLWNVEHIYAEPLGSKEVDQLMMCAQAGL